MKPILYKITTALVAASLLGTGCTKDFESLNTDTNSVTADKYIPAYNLTRAQLELTGNNDFSYETWRVNIIYCSMMMQQLANTSWYAGDKYIQNDGWSNSYFEVAYKDQVKYVIDLIQVTKDDPKLNNLHQAGRILKAMTFQRLTDLYGDIPYSEAGLGFYNRIFTPKYDTQQSIYLDMLKELEEAALALDPAGDKISGADLIYRGASNSVELWKKLAYSMMLKLAMRLTKIDANTAKAWAEKAAAGGVFTDNAHNAYVLHDASGGRNTVNRNSNILSGEWDAVGKGETFLSKTMVDHLKNNNDPRLRWMAQVKSSGSTLPADQVGLPNGYDQNGAATDVSTAPGYPGNINQYSTIRKEVWLRLDGPTFLLSYAQVELLLAEAAKRGWNVGGTAADHYKKGVTAAMEMLKQYNPTAVITETEINNYLAAHPYNDAAALEQLNTQYWVASFLDWYEVFANWRRSGYPTLTPVNYVGNATGGKIPRRMLYPASEASANGKHYQEAISRQGPNTFLSTVWWDKN
ncbi:MAG: SusD/RagB family nutrient-binding outer membrane lipoprotein [Chitinophagaceae bacterium]